jgi:type VI secretion system ImpC/EvpB family protein
MPKRFDFDVTFGRTSPPREEATPMRILLLGDFSNRSAIDRLPLARRPTIPVDVDTFGQVMRRLAPRVELPLGGLQFADIDDFHPDRLAARLEVFRDLRHKRAHPPADDDDSLARLLGKSSSPPPAAAPVATALDALLREMVAPHVVKDTSAQTKMYVDLVDSEMTAHMRALLHDPRLQSLEAAWRGLHWLVTSLELSSELQLHIFDVSREELLEDVVHAQGKVTATGTYAALVDRWRNVPGGQGWSAIATLLQFGSSETDVGLLAALGVVASQAGGPLLGSGDATLSGVSANSADAPPESASWDALRQSEVAPWIGLAAPRVLLRLPYGARGDVVETFAFEEFSDEPEHEHFLWGSGSLALAVLIGRAFTARGWDMELGDEREIDDLPAFVFERDGEKQLQACAERFLTESQLQRLIEHGLIPIASRRDRNGVVVIRFQSVSAPPAPLVW